MDNVIGLLVVLYLIGSVVSALVKKAQQGPVKGDFGDEPSSPYRPVQPPQPIRPPEPLVTESPEPVVTESPEPVVMQKPATPLEQRASAKAESAKASSETVLAVPSLARTAPPTQERRREKRSTAKRPTQAEPPVVHRGVRNVALLRQGIVLSEVLGPPRALRPHPWMRAHGRGPRR